MASAAATTEQANRLSYLADCAEASEGDRILDRDIEIEIQNLHGRGHDDPRDNITARKVLISHGAQPHNYEIVAFSGISLRTPLEYTAHVEAAMSLVPEGMILRQYKAGKLVPHMWEVSVGPDNGGFIGNSDHSSACALTAACLRALAKVAA